MTDRAPAPGEVPMACPFVAFADDRARRSTAPDHRHRCFAEVPAAPRALAHQETYCLTANFPACPTFQDWARREAARSSSGDGRGEVAAGRPEDALAFVAEPGDDRAGAGEPQPAASDQPGTSQQLGAFDQEVGAPGDEELAALVGGSGGGAGRRTGLTGSRGGAPEDEAVEWQGAEPDDLPPFLADRDDRSPGPASGPSDAEAAWVPTAGVGAGRGSGRVADRSSQRTADHAAPPWEPPRRFEAYPNIRTRPRLEGAGRPPTLAIGVVALAIAALILFLLPGFLGGGSPAGSPTPTAGSSAVASVSPTPVPASPSPTAAVYVVKAGDTLSAIAHRFGLTIEELQAANPQIKNPDRIAIGDEINIPTPAAPGSAGTGGASASGGASATTAP